jgi:predicted MPP superfamily phosphohydrolase
VLSRWVRRCERGLNQLLALHVYPWLPGLRLPYGFQLSRHLTVSEAEVPVPGLPAAFDGMTVLLMTDIHAGPFVSSRALARTFRRLQGLEPDLILLGGDLITATHREFESAAEAFSVLQAPLGVFAVLGNHDHYSGDPATLRRLIEAAGIPVLHNRIVDLTRDTARLRLAGIDDLHWGKPDLGELLPVTGLAAHAGTAPGTSLPVAAAAGGVLREPAVSSPAAGGGLDRDAAGSETPVILLSHNPDVFFDAVWRGVALVLSGHTHGGQIRLPGFPLVVKMSRYALDEGRYTADGVELVVSRGLGVTGLPLRFACAPEAVFLRLQAA